MKILPLDADPAAHQHINRFVDVAGSKLYLIETKADYAALPQSIKDMLTASVVVLPDGTESNQYDQLRA